MSLNILKKTKITPSDEKFRGKEEKLCKSIWVTNEVVKKEKSCTLKHTLDTNYESPGNLIIFLFIK